MPTLTLPGDLNSLEPLTDLVLEQAELAGLDTRATYQLRLAVDEIATNIILHGYQEQALQGEIVVTAEVNDQALVVTLEDTAPPYNPLKRDINRVKEDFEKPLHERSIGGLGVYFAIHAVSEFHYEWRNGRNRNIFVVHRTSPTATEGSTAHSAHA